MVEADAGASLVADVDHSRNAQATSGTLRPTRLMLVEVPGVDGDLLRLDQRVGLELPHKLLVYEEEAGGTLVGYNTVEYLTSRYNVGGSALLGVLAETLDGWAEAAAGSGQAARTTPAAGVTTGEGIVVAESDADVTESYRRLRSAILNNPALSVEAEVNLQATSQAAGFQLRPTQLIVFSNSGVDTPVMEASQTTALDLPQKILLYQNAAGQVLVAYNDPAYLADRHEVPVALEEVAQMQATLAQLAEVATDRFARRP